MAKSKFPPRLAEVITARSGEACEATVSPGCVGHGQHLHHRKLRSQGGEHTAENCVSVCHVCHTWIHANTGKSYEHGWLVRQWADPAYQPVRIQGSWVRLSETYTLADVDWRV